MKAQFSHPDREPRTALGRYRFDRQSRQLYRGAQPVRLTPKSADLLELLVAHRGRLITREQIMQALWPQGFVLDGNLTQTVYLLRKTFADEPAISIENIPRRGYRLGVSRASRFGALQTIVAAVAVLIPFLHPFSTLAALPPAAYQPYRLALYHLQRPAELGLARKYFLETERIAPQAPHGYAGVAILDAMYAANPAERARSCAEGLSAVRTAASKGESSLGRTARALFDFMCDRSTALATRDMRIALQEDPEDPVVLNVAARLSLWAGKPDRAVDYARRAAAVQPDSPEVLSTLGLAEYYDGKFQAASADFRRAIEIMPDARPLKAYLTRSLAALRRANVALRDDEALRELRRLRAQNTVAAQLDWLSDYRFAPLRRHFPGMVAQFVTYR